MNMPVTKEDFTAASTWLHQMNNAAVKNNISILYSDAYPRHLFQSLLLPAVTQTRASQDYGEKNKDQWKIGISSIFADALNLVPNKDSFRTCHNVSGNNIDYVEPYPELEMVVALLSKGPVGIGDRLGFEDSSIIKKCCSTDGKLLQPMRPAKAIDSQILQSAFQDGSGPDGEVWSTYTTIPVVGTSKSSNATYGVIFAAGLTKPFDITPENTHLNFDVSRPQSDFPKSKIYRWNQPDQFFDFSKDNKFTLQNCPLANFCLYFTTPIIEFGGQEVLILGELDKWIHMPYQRVTQISVTETIDLEINGAANEEVQIWVAVNGNVGALVTRADGNGLAHLKYDRKPTNRADYLQFSKRTLLACVVFLIIARA
ncbi:uncharacterized protein LOC126820819 [Patella vulgata]|uniref:uncharacterized protein LOC126820819 n=1 Tax=Patella vulgata TaxID=6465 RepID=UPI0024A8907F|nr:uncharacterized protein LOC126820819 [Patella vulgata]